MSCSDDPSPYPRAFSLCFQISGRIWRHFLPDCFTKSFVFLFYWHEFQEISLRQEPGRWVQWNACIHSDTKPTVGHFHQKEGISGNQNPRIVTSSGAVIKRTCEHWGRTTHPCPFGFWTPTPSLQADISSHIPRRTMAKYLVQWLTEVSVSV